SLVAYTWLRLLACCLFDERLELGVGPWFGSTARGRARLLHERGVDRRSGLSPLAADVREHRRDLVIAEHRPERRHEADLSLLAVEQDSRRDASGSQRQRGTDERRRDFLFTPPIRLMARLAHALVDILT